MGTDHYENIREIMAMSLLRALYYNGIGSVSGRLGLSSSLPQFGGLN